MLFDGCTSSSSDHCWCLTWLIRPIVWERLSARFYSYRLSRESVPLVWWSWVALEHSSIVEPMATNSKPSVRTVEREYLWVWIIGRCICRPSKSNWCHSIQQGVVWSEWMVIPWVVLMLAYVLLCHGVLRVFEHDSISRVHSKPPNENDDRRNRQDRRTSSVPSNSRSITYRWEFVTRLTNVHEQDRSHACVGSIHSVRPTQATWRDYHLLSYLGGEGESRGFQRLSSFTRGRVADSSEVFISLT